MTAEDLYAFRFLTDAQLSPDGERVAYAVRTVPPERDGIDAELPRRDVDQPLAEEVGFEPARPPIGA